MLDLLFRVFELSTIAYLLVVIGHYLVLSAIAIPALVRLRWRAEHFHTSEAVASASAPPISLLVPMYNEEPVCVESVRALLGVSYPSRQILVVNDGSKDGTVARLTAAFEFEETPRLPTSHLHHATVRAIYRSRIDPALWLIDKENGGKADALNAGLAYCQTPLFCMLDGDSLLANDALLRAVQPFLQDATTIAVGGTIGIVNDSAIRHGRVLDVRMPTSWVARFQALEYIRAFAASRVGWSSINALMIISGAFGLFRREPVVAVGGLDEDTVGEDMELVMRLHRYHRDRKIPYRIGYAPDAVSWTECPESLTILGRQRDRWHRGLAQILWRHRGMLYRRRYGPIGWLAFPVFLFIELIGPAYELLGLPLMAVLWWTGYAYWPIALQVYLLTLVLGATQSLAAIALEQLAFRRYTRTRDIALLMALAVIENVGYRQLTVFWRVRGLVNFLRDNQSWGEMTRTGFATEEASPLPT